MVRLVRLPLWLRRVGLKSTFQILILQHPHIMVQMVAQTALIRPSTRNLPDLALMSPCLRIRPTHLKRNSMLSRGDFWMANTQRLIPQLLPAESCRNISSRRKRSRWVEGRMTRYRRDFIRDRNRQSCSRRRARKFALGTNSTRSMRMGSMDCQVRCKRTARDSLRMFA